MTPSTRFNGGYCNWFSYYTSGIDNLCCGVQSLWNIYMNMGWNEFGSYESLGDDIKSVTGKLTYTTIVMSTILNYFSAKNIYSNHSSSGYMSLSAVQTMTQYNHRYGMAFNHGPSIGHITSIIGYYASTNGSYYIMHDSHGGPGNGRVSVDYTLRTFTSCGVSYIWSDGYIANIRR
jgi:hypothetical protein